MRPESASTEPPSAEVAGAEVSGREVAGAEGPRRVRSGEGRRRSIVRTALLVEAIVLLLAVLLGQVLGAPPFESIELSWRDLALGVAGTMPLALFASWSLHSTWRTFTRLRDLVFERVVPMFERSSTAGLVLLSLAAGVCEEALFRGVLLTALADGMGATTALIVTSALFGLAHAVSPAYAFVAGVLGAYLGGLFIATGNIFVPIVVHALYDFVGLRLLLDAASLRTRRPI